MALYRQIAGSGVPPNQVGLTISQIFSATKEAINPLLMQPVDYNTPIQTIQPSQPVTNTTSPFLDPRTFDPNITTIDTTPLPLPEGTAPIQTTTSQPITSTTSVLPVDIKTAIANNALPLFALAGVILVAVSGDVLFHEKRKIALLGGLGLLYYGMAKNKIS